MSDDPTTGGDEGPPEFGPVARTPLSLLVAQQLREAIVSGALAVGSTIPTEKALAAQFAVSRTSVREALRVLQAQGLLSGGDTVSTARPRVTDAATVGSAATAIENALRLHRVPLADLVQLRLIVEGEAVEQAAARPDEQRLAEAHAALEVMRDPLVGLVAFHDADVAFHVSLVAAGANLAYDLVLSALRDAIAGYLLDALTGLADPAGEMRRLAAEHGAILLAVEDGDGTAARTHLNAHIRDFYTVHAGLTLPDA